MHVSLGGSLPRRGSSLILAIVLATALASEAAGQWVAKITPTLNPLPIGLCGAVQIQVDDGKGGGRPRNPAGYLISLADFAMSVTSPEAGAVAGQQVDATHWSVCACQAGVAGAVATITASYPANRLSPKDRVPGVAFQTTTTVTLAAPKGSGDPTGCGSPAPATIAAAAPATPVQAAPSGKTATQPAGPVAAPQPVPLPSETGTPREAPTAGPPPAGVTVTGTLTLAHVTWGFSGASSYSVQRWMQNNPKCCRASSSPLGARETAWDDPLPSTGTYVYRVTAIYADGRQGFVDVNYVSEPTNPAVLTATWLAAFWQVAVVGFGQQVPWWRHHVRLDWSKVPGAAYYVLSGPGLPFGGLQLNTTVSNSVETHHTTKEVTTAQVPGGAESWAAGMNTWTVAAYFLPGPVSTAPASFPKASLALPQCVKTALGTCTPK